MNGFTAAEVTFDVRDDQVVVDTNPEMADYDNQRGEIYGLAYYVVATNAAGDRVCRFIGTDRYRGEKFSGQAERMAAALTVRAASGRLPTAFASWQQDRPAYGSDAYVAYGQADDLAWEASFD